MMDYQLLKQVHMSLALISLLGFCLRWRWRMLGSEIAFSKPVRILPHFIDTLFLITGIYLVYLLGTVPVNIVWLTAKICGLLGYIILGLIAMRTAPLVRYSLPAFISAILIFTWIVSVARLKTPQGVLTLILPGT